MKRSRFVPPIVCLAAVLAASPANGAIIHIPQDYATIQAGINASGHGDTILPAVGTYHEQLIINHPLSLMGEQLINTYVDGSGNGTVIFIASSYVHLARLNVTSSGGDPHAAGIEIAMSDSCVIEECDLFGNTAGLFLHESSNNIITRNRFFYNINGVLFHDDMNNPPEGNLFNQITHNVFVDNDSFGVKFDHIGTLDYHNCNIIASNRIEDNLDGMYLIMSEHNEILQNDIIANDVYGIRMYMCMGGGMWNSFYRNNFVGNNADGVQAINYGGPNNWYSIGENVGNFWSDYTGVDADSDGFGDTPYLLDGDDSNDPYPFMARLYASVGGTVTSAFQAPLEDVLVTAVGADVCDTTDAAGHYFLGRLGSGMYDIAFSKTGYADTMAFRFPTSIGIDTVLDMVMFSITSTDDEVMPGGFATISNYPNPFNAQTTIRYFLSEPSSVEISIYDILGRKIWSLSPGLQTSGEHGITWDAERSPSGIYFYRLHSGERFATGKIMLLR